jgi:hypothetical protein
MLPTHREPCTPPSASPRVQPLWACLPVPLQRGGDAWAPTLWQGELSRPGVPPRESEHTQDKRDEV